MIIAQIGHLGPKMSLKIVIIDLKSKSFCVIILQILLLTFLNFGFFLLNFNLSSILIFKFFFIFIFSHIKVFLFFSFFYIFNLFFIFSRLHFLMIPINHKHSFSFIMPGRFAILTNDFPVLISSKKGSFHTSIDKHNESFYSEKTWEIVFL